MLDLLEDFAWDSASIHLAVKGPFLPDDMDPESMKILVSVRLVETA